MKRQILRFGSVGLVVTLTDFVTLNILIALSVPLLVANIGAVTVAMLVSFRLNQKLVFGTDKTSAKAKVLFFTGTAFSLYVLQTIIIFSLLRYQNDFVSTFGLSVQNGAWISVLYANLAKLVATVISATFNFIYYKKVVFVER